MFYTLSFGFCQTLFQFVVSTEQFHNMPSESKTNSADPPSPQTITTPNSSFSYMSLGALKQGVRLGSTWTIASSTADHLPVHSHQATACIWCTQQKIPYNCVRLHTPGHKSIFYSLFNVSRPWYRPTGRWDPAVLWPDLQTGCCCSCWYLLQVPPSITQHVPTGETWASVFAQS